MKLQELMVCILHKNSSATKDEKQKLAKNGIKTATSIAAVYDNSKYLSPVRSKEVSAYALLPPNQNESNRNHNHFSLRIIPRDFSVRFLLKGGQYYYSTRASGTHGNILQLVMQ